MKVLDLFSGLDGWGAAFRDRGHQVVSLDLDPRFGSDFQMDILNLNGLGKWDVVLASPPCETFSVMSIGTYWTGGRGAYQPTDDPKNGPIARRGLAIMNKTFELIDKAQPRYYVVENPRGVMRKVSPRPPTTTVWYCQYGVSYAKPTDLWTNLTGTFLGCKNRNPDHEPAPRGNRTGVQGVFKRKSSKSGSAALRSVIPYELSLAICLACETDGVVRGPVKPQLELVS